MMFQYVDPNSSVAPIPDQVVRTKMPPRIVKEISVQTDDLAFSGNILNS